MYNSTQMKDNKKQSILIVSWAVAIIFIILGIVSLSGGFTKEQSSNISKRLTLNQSYSTTAKSYSEQTFKFTPSSTGVYYLKMDGAILEDARTAAGSYVSNTTVASSSYDSVYKMTLSSGVSYTFTTSVGYSGSIYIIISDYNY